MAAHTQARLEDARTRLAALSRHSLFCRPFEAIHDRFQHLADLELRLTRAARRRHRQSQDALHALAATLESLSPLAVLSRGYSVTVRRADGQVVGDAAEVASGEQIITRLAKGELLSRIEEAQPPRVENGSAAGRDHAV